MTATKTKTVMDRMMQSNDLQALACVTQALLRMTKFEIGMLQRAYTGA